MNDVERIYKVEGTKGNAYSSNDNVICMFVLFVTAG